MMIYEINCNRQIYSFLPVTKREQKLFSRGAKFAAVKIYRIAIYMEGVTCCKMLSDKTKYNYLSICRHVNGYFNLKYIIYKIK